MIELRNLLFCLLLLAPVAAVATPLVKPAAMPLGPGPDRVAAGVARMVDSILEFTHWPTERPTVRLCLAGAVAHGERLDEVDLSDGTRLSLLPLAGDASPPWSQCDALYIGALDAAAARRLIAATRGAPIVTIAEDDPECSSGAMFCLLFEPQSLSFQLNIDAISRSLVRIDPRVLRMAKGGY
ncbi:YfiR family protein [Sphingobium sp. AP49]|uniref:YfiR family protein n=1 Tax=Sphingobium sp. AP49 TaxID=1144307 RepID=UPI0002EE9BCB|nr:YfiR family protein [Sphingobium sp. AP49]WHO40173.1 YfiR family protein [Sphingobium sp. AP49]